VTALTWLNDLAQWLGRWFPRLTLVHPTHKGVRFGRGGAAVAVGPGLVLWWPLIHDMIQVPVTTISYQTNALTLFLKSAAMAGGVIPKVAVVALAVQFRVTEPVTAAVKALNFHAIVDNRVRAAVAKHWTGSIGADGRWLDDAKREAALTLASFGIQIEAVDLTDIGEGCALKNMSDWSYSDGTDGKRPTSV